MRNYITATKIIVKQIAEARFNRFMSGSNHIVSNVAMADALAAVYDMDAPGIEADLDQRVDVAVKAIKDDYGKKG